MKFLCEHCKAKYQIPDAKIAGRNLRMKCRKCQNEIIIRGPKKVSKPRPRVASSSRRVQPRSRPSSQAAPRSALGADFRRAGALAPAAVAPPVTSTAEWYVAINDVPVGPIRREEVARKISVGAVGPTSLCWREGLGDWAPVSEVAELAALLPKAPRAPAAPTPPPPPSNVVPIGGRMGASAAGFDDDDENTVMTASPFAAQAAPAAQTASRPVAPAPVGAPMAPIPAPIAAPTSVPAAAVAVAPTAAPNAAAPIAAPAAAPAAAPMAAPIAAPMAPLAPAPMAEPARRKLAPGLLIALVGAGAFGIAFAVIVAQKMLAGPPEQPRVAEVLSEFEPSAAEPIHSTIDLEPEVPEVPEEDPGTPTADDGSTAPEPGTDPSAETAGSASGMGGSGRSNTAMRTSMGGATMEPARTAEQQRLIDHFGMGGGGDLQISNINTGMGGTSQMRPQLDNSAVSRVVHARANQNGLQRCYNTAIRGNPNPPNVRLDVRIHVTVSGRVNSASARGQDVGQLKSCIERTVRRWRFPASSEGGDAAFPLVFSAPG